MPKPVHLGGCVLLLFDRCGLLFPPFAAAHTDFDLFKLSDKTAPSFPVMVPLRLFPSSHTSRSLVHRHPRRNTHDPSRNSPFIQQVHPNKGQNSTANQRRVSDLEFQRIQDAALPVFMHHVISFTSHFAYNYVLIRHLTKISK